MTNQGYNRFICMADWDTGFLDVSWNDIKNALINSLDVIILPKVNPTALPSAYGDDDYTNSTMHYYSIGIAQNDGADVYWVQFTVLSVPGGGDPNEIVVFPFAAPTPDAPLVCML